MKYSLQGEMKTRAELAFDVLDPEKTGFITPRQLKMLSSKLSDTDVKALMTKVVVKCTKYYDKTNFKRFILTCDCLF